MRTKQVKYRRNGSLLAFGYLKDGRRHGYWKWYREDGTKLKTGYFNEGKLAKKWMKYDKRGRLIQ